MMLFFISPFLLTTTISVEAEVVSSLSTPAFDNVGRRGATVSCTFGLTKAVDFVTSLEGP